GNFIFTAEVASTANELLMLKYLIKNAASDEERLYFLNYLAEQIRGTVYIQVMYSEFEKAIHERVEQGEALSVDSLNALTRSLLEKYYGPGYAIDDLGLLWWSRIPHFYRNFYVYKYATAMAAANELVKQMEEGGNPQRYLEFLKAGTSDYPINILKKAGVDMTTTEPVDNLLKEFAGILDEMEAILKKQGKIR
ncbi:MAG: M3 family metallopeptidase, partial [Bacillota bacterium]